MDVVSLLNQSNGALDQQKSVASPQIPIRNRTPWDAGGYSMPISSFPMPSVSPTRQNSCEESRLDSSTSTAHKASDSRSSLSSFASHQSATHSRFSSMSTVNSWNPIEGIDCLSPELRTVQEALKHASLSVKTDPDEQQKSDIRPRSSVSPSSSLGTLAAAAEHQLYDLNQKLWRHSTRSPASLDVSMNTPPLLASIPARPSSPSDAILIKRPTLPSLRVNTGDLVLDRELPQINHNYLKTHLHSQSQNTSTHLKGHKRAVSAPDFNFNMSSQQPHGPQAEPTPPSSIHPDRSSPMSPAAYAAPDTPPATSGEADPTSVVCMYIPNCDTGSQLRKAISHIFGRNKMCTRLIPQEVWVHYCRKHYQRSRYRNPKEYAKLQCDLVQQQIRRVHEWSQANMTKGLPGTVQDWGLAVRKREQKRLDDLGGSNRKRRADAFERNESDEEGNVEENTKVPPTAVPSWLLAHCGQGYSTHGILDIFNRLHTEILSDRMSCFPDIEILPNIVVDREGDVAPKGYAKRSSAATGHKRSQSLGVGIKSDYFSQDRRLSQVSQSSTADDSPYESPAQKKRRPNRLDDSIEGLQYQQRPRERSQESARRNPYHTHRPVFANIDEHQVMEDAYSQHDTPMRDSFYSRSPAYGQTVLAAPVPQRLSSTPVATQLEYVDAQEPSHRRLSHHRSMSDLGASQTSRPPYPSSHSYAGPPTQHESVHADPYMRRDVYESQPQKFRGREPHHYRRSGGHLRNQSTPIISGAYAESLARGSAASSSSHAYHPQHQSAMHPSRCVIETNDSRTSYAERR